MTQKSVSWNRNLETSCEFESSVMEQNVFVGVDTPDEEFQQKEPRSKHNKEKGNIIKYVYF